jgi:steroid delta-isomerase-like uncharacterized protein
MTPADALPYRGRLTHRREEAPMDLVTLYHQANDAWNRHDRDAYVALHADDCEIVAPGSTGKGHQGVLDFWADSAGPFPDNRATPRTVVADGTTVVEESVWEGTNTGPLTMPDGSELPPTGAVVSVPYVGVHTVRGGRFVSSHYYWDQMAFLKPLGLLPS